MYSVSASDTDSRICFGGAERESGFGGADREGAFGVQGYATKKRQ